MQFERFMMSSCMENDKILRCPLGPDKFIPSTAFQVTLFNGLRRAGNRIALVDAVDGRSITFDNFLSKAELVARQLLRVGCQQSDVIAIFSPNSFDWMITAAAVLRIGAIIAAVNHLLTPDELKHQLKLSRAKVMYTVDSLMPNALEAITDTDVQMVIVNGKWCHTNNNNNNNNNIDGKLTVVCWDDLLSADTSHVSLSVPANVIGSVDDPAMILFSSGTTGPQKAVMLSHRNIHTQFLISRDSRVKKIRPNEIMFAPFAHIKGCLFTLYNLAVGYTTYIMQRFSLKMYLQLVASNKLDSLSVVPAIAVQLAKSCDVDEFDLSCVKEIVCGTAPLRPEVENLLCQRFSGLILRQAYGLTETSSIVTNVPCGLSADFIRTKSGSVGVPLYNTQIKVVDLNTGEALNANQDGEICIRSPLVMVGYAGNPEATAQAIDHEGWLHTGDVGHYDADQFLYIVDRIKELIKYKSYQVAPAELEAVLLSHPDVVDAGVTGIPDSSFGELPTAIVVKRSESHITESDLQLYVSEHVAPYKRLRGGVRFVSSIPKAPSGKILRTHIRQQLTRCML